jgi:acetyltransferase-like isoleucine patch superfamily enzyme
MSIVKKIIDYKKSFFRDHGKNNHVFIIETNGCRREIHRLNKSSVKFKGNNNTIEIYEPYDKLVLNIIVCDNTHIVLHPSQYPRNIAINGYCNNNNKIVFGHDFSTTDKLQISLLRGPGNIIIGDDCMFASYDLIQMGDGHAIYSAKTNEIINNNKDIIIGNHVWVADNVTLLKGTKIGDNSVIGLKTIVTKQYDQNNVIIAGTPAKIVKTDVNWTRKSQY